MRLELGINTCFAVKRWPTPADWAPIVRDRLGLRLHGVEFDNDIEHQRLGVLCGLGPRFLSRLNVLDRRNVLIRGKPGCRSSSETECENEGDDKIASHADLRRHSRTRHTTGPVIRLWFACDQLSRCSGGG